MQKLEDSVVIERPIGEVWAYVTDLFNAPRISGTGIIGLRQISPGPFGVGSMLQGRRVVLGFESLNTVKVTEWDPPHTLAAITEGLPFRTMMARLTLHASAEGATRLVMVSEFELQPAMKLAWLFMGPFVRRRIRAGLGRAKALIEAKPR